MSAADAESVRSASISPSAQSRKSITQRFGSLFGAKASHVNKFAIELDDDVKTYGPGDSVTGTVVLDVARPLGVTHVIVCLYGNVEVFKNHSRPRRSLNEYGRTATGKGKRWVSEYYGDGFVSLFEEELILCGEGRLDPKLYHFRFDIEFPSHLGLPSSIEFERGAISYMVTATITRPATIAPTMSCDRRVVYKEDINIAFLPPPKLREATLRPVDRDTSSKTSIRRLTSNDGKRGSQASNLAQTIHNETPTRYSSASNGPPSPVAVSSRSSSASHGAVSVAAAAAASRSSHASPNWKDESPKRAQSIHTTVELTKSGCLPGQIAYVRITINNHNRVIANAKGVIITLYRQARVDMHPNLPLGPASNGSRKYEDYYPRSKSGLGGLSLSAAGSSQVWRKDLSQTTSPLYINPATMSADLRIGVRVPDEAFPSIRNVPGEMISFKYYVEVIIDIQGKLHLQDKMPSNVEVRNVAQAQFDGRSDPRSGGAGTHMQTMVFGPHCFDTSQFRRDKHAVVVQCDLIIGTRDYSVGKAKAPEATTAQTYAEIQNPVEVDQGSSGPRSNHHYADWPQGAPGDYYYDGWDVQQAGHGANVDETWFNDGYYEHPYYIYTTGDEQHYGQGYHAGQGSTWPWPVQATDSRHARTGLESAVPIPSTVDEPGLSEKERIRRQEASLLPSQPPGEDGPSAADEQLPTAPNLPDGGIRHDRPQWSQPHLNNDTIPNSGLDSSPRAGITLGSNGAVQEAAPGYTRRAEGDGSSQSFPSATAPEMGATDDKMELERRRLAAEASSPVSAGPSATVPSAPPALPDEVHNEDNDVTPMAAPDRDEAVLDGGGGEGGATGGGGRNGLAMAEPHDGEELGEALPRYEQ